MFDFPASPALNDTYTSGGVTYSWNGSAWIVVPGGLLNGVYKIAAGITGAAAANLDIPFPAASGWPGGFELLLSNYQPVAATDTLWLRHSNDGSTFQAGASYRYVGFTYNDAGGAPSAGIASTAATQIVLSGTTTNAAGFRTSWRLWWPSVDNSQAQQVTFDGFYYNGTNFVKINGVGVNTTTASQGVPLAVRLLLSSGGNIAAGLRWQLNGFK